MSIRVVWSVVEAGRLDDATRAALTADLDARRLGKIQRFHRQADRDRGLAAHALLRRVLAEEIGGKPAEVEFAYRCTGCGSTEHGKPYLPGHEVEFNLSHSGDRVVVALTPPAVPVGVDVEGPRDVDWAKMRNSVFADPEWVRTERATRPDVERARLWSRKEAAVKASGHGLTMPMRSVEIEPLRPPGDAGPTGAAGLERWSARLAAAAGTVSGWDLELATPDAGTEGYAAAVGVQVDGIRVDSSAVRAALLGETIVELRPL